MSLLLILYLTVDYVLWKTLMQLLQNIQKCFGKWPDGGTSVFKAER